MAMDEKGLGKRVQSVRKSAGLTQQDLCQKANLSYSTLAKIERGAIKTPSVFTIQGIARALNISLDELLGGVQNTAGGAGDKKTSKDGVKFVYFDVNGCLVHGYQNAFDLIAKENGISKEIVQATYERYDGPLNRGEMTLRQFNEALARQANKVALNWEEYYLRSIEPVAGMIDMVNKVAAEYEVGLLTNAMPTMTSRMRASGLVPDVAYNAVIESCEVLFAKPDANIFTIAAEQSGHTGSEILLIDDTRTNLEAAEQLGWQTLWFDDYFPAQSIDAIKSKLELA